MKRKRWKNNKKAEFLLRLGTLMEQGYTLSEGIGFLKYHQKPQVREIIDGLSQKLREGEPFHEVLAMAGFSGDVLGYLYFSEQHGDLAFALKEGGEMLQRREGFKGRFQKLVRYPLFLLWLAVMLVIFMMNFLFPQFRSLYRSLDLDFPWFTRLFLELISMAPAILTVCLALAGAAFLYYILRFRRLSPHKQVFLLMHIPLLHSFLPIVITQYFTIQLSCLLKGGLSIRESLTIFEKQDHLVFFQQEAVQMKGFLRNGERFEDILKHKSFYAKELSEVVAHGQTNGNLAKELFHYSELLLELLESKVTRWISMLQPALFGCIGTVVLGMFVSMLLPIFNLMNAM